jgi:hypothetical protein
MYPSTFSKTFFVSCRKVAMVVGHDTHRELFVGVTPLRISVLERLPKHVRSIRKAEDRRKIMAHLEKRSVLLTPTFRVAFPQIAEPTVFAPGQKRRYSCIALFNIAEIKADRKELEKWQALEAAINEVALEAFKKHYKHLDRAVYTLPFHSGEEKEQYPGFGPGIVFFTMSAYRRPEIIGPDNARIDAADFYPGCYARASVNPFANRQWKSIAISLNNLQKLREGDRLDGATSAEEDFSSDPAESAQPRGTFGAQIPRGDETGAALARCVAAQEQVR